MREAIGVFLFLMLLFAMYTPAKADDRTCSVSHSLITNTGNRGAHFDVDGGMRHGGLTILYPTKQQTTFVNGAETFKPGYRITGSGVLTENGMCRLTSAEVST